MIQPSDWHINLIEAIRFILDLYLISAKGYKNANVEFLTIKTTSEILINMKDVGSGIGVKNISDLVLK